jgi:putative acetyltransferase
MPRVDATSAVSIRPERPADHAAVFRVIERAFGQDAEARLVEALRGSAAFIPELSLVAVEGESVLGHALFSRIVVRDGTTAHAALALAPMAVAPERQRAGIGSALAWRTRAGWATPW